MNPMTNMKNVLKLSQQELQRTFKTTWHDQYRNSAWIFIGGLPYDLTEGDIICVFSQYGEIVNINLVRDKDSGKQKGFCFVCYEDQRSTDLAVDNFNGIKILGRTIRVDHVNDYKMPKDKKNSDAETRKLQEEGCGPNVKLEKRPAMPIPSTELPDFAKEIEAPPDGFKLPPRLPIGTIKIEKEDDESEVHVKKEPKDKKKKKSKKKHKKRHVSSSESSSESSSSSSEESSSEEEQKKSKKSKKSKKEKKKTKIDSEEETRNNKSSKEDNSRNIKKDERIERFSEERKEDKKYFNSREDYLKHKREDSHEDKYETKNYQDRKIYKYEDRRNDKYENKRYDKQENKRHEYGKKRDDEKGDRKREHERRDREREDSKRHRR